MRCSCHALRSKYLVAARRRPFSTQHRAAAPRSYHFPFEDAELVLTDSYVTPNVETESVKDFWDAIMKFSTEPESFQLGQNVPSESFADKSSDEKLAFAQQLLKGAVRSGKEQGDLLPSLYARKCCELYEILDKTERARFMKLLGTEFGVDRNRVLKAASAYTNEVNDKVNVKAQQDLREAMIPACERFFAHINQLPGGMKFLVHMRQDILEIMQTDNSPALRLVNDWLKQQLQGWFGIGNLDLERISWSTSANVLEKIMKYEAVHEVPGWDSLKQRLGTGRLCYSFFHRAMPHEPLTFVHVALTQEIADNVQDILNDPSPGLPHADEYTTAIFYSISSSQRGLSGVDLGNFLIKRVVKEIQKHVPSVTTFCTLSPIPNFRHWLNTQLNNVLTNFEHGAVDPGLSSLILDDETDELSALYGVPKDSQLIKRLQKSLNDDDSWLTDSRQLNLLKPILLRLCGRYLLVEKKRTFAYDPVANFHIRNGACVHRINWLADTSAKGLRQSFGIMANYNYVLPQVERNNQQYLLDGTISIITHPNNSVDDDNFITSPDPSLIWAVQQLVSVTESGTPGYSSLAFRAGASLPPGTHSSKVRYVRAPGEAVRRRFKKARAEDAGIGLAGIAKDKDRSKL
ncbi:malonyl-CoA decarboxylase-domain-containing protein [Cladochytrium replicatum]|nr:malonyl-CoA decarboxylase-domain-containing protein [Cladochytrium replicatum]